MCVYINAKYIFFATTLVLKYLKGQGGNLAQINCPPQDTRGVS
jgi:hypothetical protein